MGRHDDIEHAYGLSPMQQGMLFHSVARPRPGADIQQLVCSSREPLDVPAFLSAWERVIARHAILRTSFRWTDLPAPRQEVHRKVTLPVTALDLRGLAPAEQAARRRAFLLADRARGFVLTEAPCARLALLRVDDARMDVVWTFHHILLDGRSFLTVLREVFAHYDARRAGRELDLPEPRPFRDYIAWLEARDPDAPTAFWRALLAGHEGPTPLPVPRRDTPAPELPELAGTSARFEARLSHDTSAALAALARAHGLTLNTLVQGAWAVLLARHAGVDDVVFGATRAGRHGTVDDAETLVGMTINTVPVRAQVPPDAPLLDVLRALREAWVAMRSHEHAPLVRIRSWAGGRGDTPLFETLLVAESYDWLAVLRAQGGAWRERELEMIEHTNFPLTLAADLGLRIVLALELDRRVVAEDDAARLLGRLACVLEGMSRGLDRAVADLPWLDAAERRKILDAWSGAAAEPPPADTIHGLFEAQVERTPDAVAVVDGQELLTYRELDRRAHRLAHHLRRLGVGPDVTVGLAVSRSAGLVVALLGVLEAGGAYVPLDPDYPAERLARILDDARVSILVTDAHTRGRLPERMVKIVLLDEDAAAIAAESDARPLGGAGPGDLAYVIYTSGSTGEPKGVAVQHGNIVSSTVARLRYYAEPVTRFLVVSSFAFDSSLAGIFGTLCQGGAIALPPDAFTEEPSQLAALLAEHRISHLLCVPALHAFLLDHLNRGVLESLQAVIVAGEAAPIELVARHHERLPGTVLFNEYGPTEASVWCTVHRTRRDEGGPRVPIGRPIAGARVYVLDAQLEPVPAGVPGDIYVAGVGVARGYLRRPDLTAERFVPSPFAEGARLYRTGDLGRWREGGELDYLGRVDHQIKIRGHRVELGGIAAALREHPGVREAVVAARDDAPGGAPRLVAYVVPEEGLPRAGSAELRAFVRERLPEPMVPHAFVILSALPRTPNGKVDRRALPAPDPEPGQASRAHVPPRTPVEELLAKIWAEELGAPRVGVHDDYFDLGGHSLVSLRIMDRAAHAGLRLTSTQLFQHHTIAELAAVIQSTPALPGGAPDASSLVAMRPTGTRPPLFLVHTGPGDVFGYTSLVRALGPDQPCYGFQSPALHDPASAPRTIEEMAARYVALLRVAAPRGPYHVAGWCYGGLVAFEMARRLRAEGHEVRLLAVIEGRAPAPGAAVPGYYVDLARALLRMGPRGLGRYLGEKVRLATGALSTPDALAGPELANRSAAVDLSLRARARWRPRPYAGRLTVIRSSEGCPGEIDEGALRWSRLAAAVDAHVIAGDHVSILREPSVRAVAALLREAMDQAARRAPRADVHVEPLHDAAAGAA